MGIEFYRPVTRSMIVARLCKEASENHSIPSALCVLPLTVFYNAYNSRNILQVQKSFFTPANCEVTSRYSRCSPRRSIEADPEQELNNDSNMWRRGTVRIWICSSSLESAVLQRLCSYFWNWFEICLYIVKTMKKSRLSLSNSFFFLPAWFELLNRWCSWQITIPKIKVLSKTAVSSPQEISKQNHVKIFSSKQRTLLKENN